jgi:hypothetical protein
MLGFFSCLARGGSSWFGQPQRSWSSVMTNRDVGPDSGLELPPRRRTGLEQAFRAAAASALADARRAGAAIYDRERALPRLIAIDPRELREGGPEIGRRIVARLIRALRAERRRGIAGHWAYDLNRHLALTQALAAEDRSL